MADFEIYSDETIAKSISTFQEKLMETDNFNGGPNPDYKQFWLSLRADGPMILSATKHLFSKHLQYKLEEQRRNKENDGTEEQSQPKDD